VNRVFPCALSGWDIAFRKRIQPRDIFRRMVGIPFFTGHAESEYAAHRARNRLFFVRANDADRNPAGVCGNHPRSLRIARLMQCNAEEAQPLTALHNTEMG
jgi:hypothetical protein